VARRQRASGGAKRLPLPPAGTVVAAGLGSHRWPTRVETVAATALEVVAPTRTLGEAILPDPGTDVTVSWTTDLGEMVASGTLAATGFDVVPTWQVAVSRVERHQRRAAYRLPVALPLTLRGGSGTDQLHTSDLSEGGLRCRLPVARTPEPGTAFDGSLELPDGVVVLLRLRVVRVSEPSDGEVDVGLAFEDVDPAAAEHVRRFVFEEQLRRRASVR
jgi:hypothetical protein